MGRAPRPTSSTPYELTADPELAAGFAESAHRILADLVRGGAPLGWVDPPPADEVAELVDRVLRAARSGDGALRAAYTGRRLVGLGYWLRYARPTNRQHADLEKVAVASEAHGQGIGRSLTSALVEDARGAGIEVLTLDARADNTRALDLYRSLGFSEYGRLPDFVAMGGRRYDKVFYMLDFRGSGRREQEIAAPAVAASARRGHTGGGGAGTPARDRVRESPAPHPLTAPPAGTDDPGVNLSDSQTAGECAPAGQRDGSGPAPPARRHRARRVRGRGQAPLRGGALPARWR